MDSKRTDNIDTDNVDSFFLPGGILAAPTSPQSSNDFFRRSIDESNTSLGLLDIDIGLDLGLAPGVGSRHTRASTSRFVNSVSGNPIPQPIEGQRHNNSGNAFSNEEKSDEGADAQLWMLEGINPLAPEFTPSFPSLLGDRGGDVLPHSRLPEFFHDPIATFDDDDIELELELDPPKPHQGRTPPPGLLSPTLQFVPESPILSPSPANQPKPTEPIGSPLGTAQTAVARIQQELAARQAQLQWEAAQQQRLAQEAAAAREASRQASRLAKQKQQLLQQTIPSPPKKDHDSSRKPLSAERSYAERHFKEGHQPTPAELLSNAPVPTSSWRVRSQEPGSSHQSSHGPTKITSEWRVRVEQPSPHSILSGTTSSPAFPRTSSTPSARFDSPGKSFRNEGSKQITPSKANASRAHFPGDTSSQSTTRPPAISSKTSDLAPWNAASRMPSEPSQSLGGSGRRQATKYTWQQLQQQHLRSEEFPDEIVPDQLDKNGGQVYDSTAGKSQKLGAKEDNSPNLQGLLVPTKARRREFSDGERPPANTQLYAPMESKEDVLARNKKLQVKKAQPKPLTKTEKTPPKDSKVPSKLKKETMSIPQSTAEAQSAVAASALLAAIRATPLRWWMYSLLPTSGQLLGKDGTLALVVLAVSEMVSLVVCIVGFLVAGTFAALLLVGQLHRYALRELMRDFQVTLCFAFPYSFRFTMVVAMEWAPHWAPVCLWYAFLVQVFCTSQRHQKGCPHANKRPIWLLLVSRVLLPLFFIAEGVSGRSYLLDLSGSELMLLSFLLAAIRIRCLASPIFLVSWSIQVLVVSIFGPLAIVQYCQLLFGLTSLHAVVFMEYLLSGQMYNPRSFVRSTFELSGFAQLGAQLSAVSRSTINH